MQFQIFFSDSTFYHIIPDNGSSITNACLPNVLMKKCDMIMFWLASNFGLDGLIDHKHILITSMISAVWTLYINLAIRYTFNWWKISLILETRDKWKFCVLPQR